MLIYIAIVMWIILIAGILAAYRSFYMALRYKPVKRQYHYLKNRK